MNREEGEPNLQSVLWWRLIPLVSSVAFLAVMWFGSNTYYGGLFAGEEWIISVAKNQVPQSERVLELAAKQRLVSVIKDGMAIETRLEPGRDLLLAIRGEREVAQYGTLEFRDVDKIIALPKGAASGFVATGDEVFELVEATVENIRYIMISGNTTALVDEIFKVSAVEVMLMEQSTGKLLQHTWRGTRNALVDVEIEQEALDARGEVLDARARAADQEHEWRSDRANINLSAPYVGYYQLRIGAGVKTMGAFYAYSGLRSVPGFEPLVILVMVPDEVMLKYPKRSIGGGIALLFLMVGLVMTMIQRLSNRHITPLTHLATRVERIRDSVVMDPPEPEAAVVDPRGRAPNHEVAALERVVGSLETEIERGLALEGQLRNSQKLEAVGRLAGGIAHDFNNLLNVVSLNVAHLRGEPQVSEDALASLELMSGAINAGAELTRKLLNFRHGGTTMFEDGSMALAGKTITDTVGLLHRLIGDEVQLSIEIPEKPIWVKMSSTDLQQIILNLTLNARDAVSAQGRVSVALAELDESGEVVNPGVVGAGDSVRGRIIVEDDGCGMSQEQLDRVYEPFFTTKEEVGGTGFGMSVVFGVVKAAGGTIEIESSEGQGTRVIVSMPLADRTDAVATADDDDPRVNAGRNLAGVRCLVVEDDERARTSLRRVLLREGMTSLGAVSGDEAIKILEQHRTEIDVVISDVMMPGGDGFKIAKVVHQSYSEIPVILMTGKPCDSSEMDEVAPLVVAIFQKPISSSKLCAAISRAVDSKLSE